MQSRIVAVYQIIRLLEKLAKVSKLHQDGLCLKLNQNLRRQVFVMTGKLTLVRRVVCFHIHKLNRKSTLGSYSMKTFAFQDYSRKVRFSFQILPSFSRSGSVKT